MLLICRAVKVNLAPKVTEVILDYPYVLIYNYNYNKSHSTGLVQLCSHSAHLRLATEIWTCPAAAGCNKSLSSTRREFFHEHNLLNQMSGHSLFRLMNWKWPPPFRSSKNASQVWVCNCEAFLVRCAHSP